MPGSNRSFTDVYEEVKLVLVALIPNPLFPSRPVVNKVAFFHVWGPLPGGSVVVGHVCNVPGTMQSCPT